MSKEFSFSKLISTVFGIARNLELHEIKETNKRIEKLPEKVEMSHGKGN